MNSAGRLEFAKIPPTVPAARYTYSGRFARIQLLARRHEKAGRTGILEASNNGRSNQSPTACYEDPSVLIHESDSMLFQIGLFHLRGSSLRGCEAFRVNRDGEGQEEQ